MLDWDALDEENEVGATAEEEADFLANVEGQEAPKACSIDQPDCEACQ